MAAWTAIRCTSEYVMDYIDINEDYSVFEIKVPKSWNGKTVRELNLRAMHNINLLGYRSEGKLNMVVHPDDVLSYGQSILVLGEHNAVYRCFDINK